MTVFKCAKIKNKSDIYFGTLYFYLIVKQNEFAKVFCKGINNQITTINFRNIFLFDYKSTFQITALQMRASKKATSWHRSILTCQIQ